jgi:CRP-like cAMP-binding protein
LSEQLKKSNVQNKTTGAQVEAKKSGLKYLKPNEILFHDNDIAESLYIIQSGQLRLYKPKGKGQVELAILRSGEVIGEMGYFDIQSPRRSCSAMAIVKTEIIEISYKAFGKTIESLNPWFKTIITTLATRLKKTNERVRSLEDNSISYGKDGKMGEYIFMTSSECLKYIDLLLFITNAQSEKISDTHPDYIKIKDFRSEIMKSEKKIFLHIEPVIYKCLLQSWKYHAVEVFQFPDLKMTEILILLEKIGIIQQEMNSEGIKSFYILNPFLLKEVLHFFVQQKNITEDKKFIYDFKSHTFIRSLFLNEGFSRNIPQKVYSGEIKRKPKMKVSNIDQPKKEITGEQVFLENIFDDLAKQKLFLKSEDLSNIQMYGLIDDFLIDGLGPESKPYVYVQWYECYIFLSIMEVLKAIDDLNKARAS